MTKQIKDTQTMYMGNLGATYTVDNWMRDFVRKLMGLSQEAWLVRNLMKRHKTEGTICSHQDERGSAEGSGHCPTMLAEHRGEVHLVAWRSLRSVHRNGLHEGTVPNIRTEGTAGVRDTNSKVDRWEDDELDQIMQGVWGRSASK